MSDWENVPHWRRVLLVSATFAMVACGIIGTVLTIYFLWQSL
jgi:hypothetical protein